MNTQDKVKKPYEKPEIEIIEFETEEINQMSGIFPSEDEY